MLRLLRRHTSGNVQKVIFLLEELGLPYEREDYGRQFGNTGDAAYLALNPTGKVPTLIDGETAVWESNSILRYLCHRAESPLLPADADARSRVERWMDWQLAAVNPHYMAIFPETKKPAEERRSDLQAVGDRLAGELAVLDRQLAGQAWIGGDHFSVADVCFGPILHRCLRFPVELPDLAELRRWHGAISERPAFMAAADA